MIEATPYEHLTPDCVLDALDSVGLRGDGRLLALNSFENRVYQVWLEEGGAVVAKFYRPGRWSDEAILEEHAFATELAAAEIPVVAPLMLPEATLHCHGGYRFTVFPRQGGRAPELDRPDVLERIGRFLGRLHLQGGARPFRHRPVLDPHSFGETPRQWLLEHAPLPPELRDTWAGVSRQALDGVARCYERAGEVALIRLHGDCHPGNILTTDAGPHFVDLDDSRMGPAVQDLWMLLSGDRADQTRQMGMLLAGYEDFRAFDPCEMWLLEALRTLRLIHYSAWIASRWNDPAFPAAFPWFDSPRYWEARILELREQVALMDEPPLPV